MHIIAFDTETYPIVTTGKATQLVVPKLVCLSFSDKHDSGVVLADEAVPMFARWIRDENVMLAGVNIYFDLNVMIHASDDPTLGHAVYEAVEDGRIFDASDYQKLADIRRGGLYSRGFGYGLKDLVKRHLGEQVEGKSGPDAWRMRYNELADVPVDQWPEAAYEYAHLDAVYTRRITEKMIEEYGHEIAPQQRILQTGGGWALSLMSAWGLMTDTEFAQHIDAYYAREEDRLAQELRDAGIMRDDGVVGQKEKKALVSKAWEDLGENPVLTAKGNISTSKNTLKVLLEDYEYDEPAFVSLIDYNRATKFRSTYMEPILDSQGGPLCPRYHTIVNSGRTSSCIAKGTPIATVDSTDAGKPIEDVKAGDWVWAFDAQGKPRICEVEWAGKTGHEAVVRVTARSKGRHDVVSFDCTPDHLVLKTDLTWCRADELEEGDGVMAISRSTKAGYKHVYCTGGWELREHRYAYVQANPFEEVPEQVHHKNEVKTDNRPSNLQGMSYAEHARHHFKDQPAEQTRYIRAWRERVGKKKAKAVYKKGPEHHRWIGLTYVQILDAMHRAEGKITEAAKYLDVSYNTLQAYAERLGIDLKDIKATFNKKGQIIDDEFIERGRAMHEAGVNVLDILDELDLDFYTWQDVQVEAGHIPYNHTIVSVEPVEGTVDVYDLRVPDVHCFIANEICVHNSGPNIQNFPSRTKPAEDEMLEAYNGPDSVAERVAAGVVTGPDIRGCFVPREGKVFVSADYTALEMATLAQVMRNWTGGLTALGAAINDGKDLHCMVARHLASCTYEEAKAAKDAGEKWITRPRNVSKIFNFSAPVGAATSTIRTNARNQGLKIPEDEAVAAHEAWQAAWPEMAAFHDHVGRFQSARYGDYFVEQHGPHRTIRGWRMRRCEKFTEAANSMFQGLAGDLGKYAAWLLVRETYLDDASPLYGARVVAFIHDEFVIECDEDRADACGEELSRVMVQAAGVFCPDIRIEADYDIHANRWSK